MLRTSFAATLAAFFYVAPANAQPAACGELDKMLETLRRDYHESPVASGTTRSGAPLFVLASPSGSWTIVVIIPSGAACIASAGQEWKAIKPPEPGDPA